MRIVIKDSAVTQPPSRRWPKIIAIILVLGTLLLGGTVLWLITPVGEIMLEAQTALQSDDAVTVLQRDWIAFIPNKAPPQAGFIFYPGARVPAEAYAPLARQIAEEGFLVTIIHAPLNLAILNPGAANQIIQNYLAIQTWVVGGHSLGGVAAVSYAADHIEVVDGLVLLASEPANQGLRETTMPIVSIYGTNDTVFSLQQVQESATKLPRSTRFIAIEGGNHAQFGFYGRQRGDSEATIEREDQIRQTARIIIDLLKEVTD